MQLASVTDQWAAMSIGRPARARHAAWDRAGPRSGERGVSVHGGGRGGNRRLPGARVPHQLLRRDGLRDRHALGPWRDGVGSRDAGGRAVRNRTVWNGSARAAADREGPCGRTRTEWANHGGRSRAWPDAEEAWRFHRPRAGAATRPDRSRPPASGRRHAGATGDGAACGRALGGTWQHGQPGLGHQRDTLGGAGSVDRACHAARNGASASWTRRFR